MGGGWGIFEPQEFFFVFRFFLGGGGWELSYFKCTNKLRRNSEITHVQARITHVQPTTGCSTFEDGKKTCTQFFLTSFDLIMPTSRSNENLQRGYQLNPSFSKILYYAHVLRLLFVCF